MTQGYEIPRVAERALLVRFLDDDLARAVARSSAAFSSLSRAGIPEPENSRTLAGRRSGSARPEWIPGGGNLLLRFDDSAIAPEIAEARIRLDGFLRRFSFTGPFASGRTIEAAVRFGGPDGEDLSAVANETGLTEAEVVARLCAAELSVAFVGFTPGFPYLVGLPPELEVPRLAGPRTQVPAGAVQIPPSGLPIVLGVDAPVTGGYPWVAQVITADLARLAHLAPGAPVRFEWVDLAAAERALAARHRRFDAGLATV